MTNADGSMERCDGCGFVWDLVAPAELPSRILETASGFRRLLLPLDRPHGWADEVRTRPSDDVWSPIEYACHVRDVVLVQRDRFYRALVEDCPEFSPMYRDERVTLGRYDHEDIGEVVAELEMSAGLFARGLAAISSTQFERTCVYAYPTTAVRKLGWLGAQTLHEMEHHWRDIAAIVAPHELGLDHVRHSPADAGRLEMIVTRPTIDGREVLATAELDPVTGLVGDTWTQRPSRRTPDRSPHPECQLTLMNSRAAALIAGERDRWPLAGDQFYVDLDLSEANLPAGTLLALGDAVVEITAEPHRGCAKFSQRFGIAALRLVNSAEGRALRLRGVNARVVRPGSVTAGSTVSKLSPT